MYTVRINEFTFCTVFSLKVIQECDLGLLNVTLFKQPCGHVDWRLL